MTADPHDARTTTRSFRARAAAPVSPRDALPAPAAESPRDALGSHGHARLLTLLEAVGDGLYALGADGRSTLVNPAAARMLGWEVEDLVGQPMHEAIHHSRPDGSPYPSEECNASLFAQ